MKLIETNIDDMNPEFYDHTMDLLFEAGALDVFLTPIQMKKNRPAVKISVLMKEELVEEVASILLQETTTLGLRVVNIEDRFCLKRELRKVSTPWGKVQVKLGYYQGKVINIAPEYDVCKKVAREKGVSLKKIYNYLQDVRVINEEI